MNRQRLLQFLEADAACFTFEISIRPFEDCCTIFAPKNPKTRPDFKKVEEYEAKWDYEAEVNEAVKNVEVIYINKVTQLF